MAETQTPLHGLKKYDTGDNPGAANLNSNVDKAELALVYAASSFPSAFPLGKILLRIDESKTYHNTGTALVPVWTQLGAGGGGGGLEELIENYESPVGVDWTTKAFTGLDGNTDEVWVLRYHLIKATAASTGIYLKPNNTANQFNWYQLFNGSPAAGNGQDLGFAGNNSGSDADVFNGEMVIYCKATGALPIKAGRTVIVSASELHQGAGGCLRQMAATWPNNVDNWTRIDVTSNVANGIRGGSWMRLYRRKASA